MKRPSSALLLVDPRDARARAQERKVAEWLEGRGVAVVRGGGRAGERGVDGADLVIVLGGDGTFLRAARTIGPREVPAIGIRLGTFGYLAELEPDGWKRGLERVLAGRGSIESWMRIRCRVRSASGRTREVGLALNEVVVTAASVARLVEVDLRVDGEDVTRFRGDGIIVATPVGSTAHSMAAGGPIVDRTDRCLLVTPLASHGLTYRPLVLRSNRQIELCASGGRHGTALTIDGQETIELGEGSVVEVCEAEHPLMAASVVERTRFRTIRERLKWGAPLAPGR